MQDNGSNLTEQAREMGRAIGPVHWEGFSQMKRWDHGILPHLREMAGFEDTFGMGTYTGCPGIEEQEILGELVDAFREGATEETEPYIEAV